MPFKAIAAWLPRPRRSLMARLVGSFLTVSLLTVGFVAIIAFYEARTALRESMAERLEGVALEKEGELNRWVDLQRDLIVFLASLPRLRSDAPRFGGSEHAAAEIRTADLLRSAIESRSDLDELFLLSPVGGRVIASTDEQRVGSYHVDDLFYSRGKAQTIIQNVYTSTTTGRPTLTIATPVRDAAGTTTAVLAGHLNLGYIDRLTRDGTALGETGEAYLVSPFNDFVSSERFGRDEFRRGVFSEGIDAALRGDDGVGVYENYAGTPVIGAYRWNVERELALVVEMDQSEAFAPARRLVATTLGIGLLSAMMLAGGVYLIAREIARPVLAVANAATAVADGDFSTVAPVMTSDEVGVLATSFNDMTERLRRLYADLNDHVEKTTRSMVALEKSQHLLQAIVDNSSTLVAVTDPDDRFLLFNKTFEQLLDVAPGEALGKTPSAILPASAVATYDEITTTVWRERRVVEREFHIIEGEHLRVFYVVAFPLGPARDSAYGVGMVATDLTDAKKAQQAQQHLEAQVQHAQKLESLGLMAGGIAHDFNNILTSLLGNTELAMKFMPASSPATEYLNKVVAATKQASDLTTQMLAYAGKASFYQETIDLNALVREMMQLVRASIPKKIDFRVDLTTDATAIQANRAQLSQLVMNLVTNAAEAVGDRPGTVRVETTRRADAPAVHLVVSDDGAGMDDKTRERIFDPFFSTKGAGRGLGLAAVRGIVRSAGGELTVRSNLDHGSTFEVWFPASDGVLDTAVLTRAERRIEGSGTILVVDDEPMVRAMARDLLESAGFHVVEAPNGIEAVERYRAAAGEIRAVILDMTMPGMSGGEALLEIRRLDPNARVILTSGYDGQDTAAYLRDTEHVAFLQKPYRARTLLAKIAAVLEMRGRGDTAVIPGASGRR